MSKLFLNNNDRRRYGFRSCFEGSGVYLAVVVFSIVIFFVWASYAEIDRVVRVEGKIIPAGHSRQIQHLEGGIVSSISTYEGAIVNKGDLLMTIEDAHAEADLNELMVKLIALQLRAARLRAEAEGKTHFSYKGKGQEDSSILSVEQQLFQSRQESLHKKLLAQEELIMQHKAALLENRARHEKLLEELALAVKRTHMFESMAAKQAASNIEVLNAQSQEKHLRTEISDAQNAVPKLEAAIRESQAEIERIKSEFRAGVQKELIDAISEMQRLQQMKVAAADRQKRTDILAPMAGVINRVGYNTIGAVVQPGQSVVELTPHSDQILIEARAKPKDRVGLHTGIKSIIRVSAFDYSALGTLKGKVTDISADTVPESDGHSYYRVKILVDRVPEFYSEQDLTPGMTVSADLVTGRRTVLAYLSSPLRKFTNSMFRDPR